ncbi:hypothetical protein [Floridanema aerugineum]|uniref:EF-hand domain-containing protein n=1 Tax=Floridaenema aerugineum BLCC-F46 TaxID=3153654 RepID=A0ABV4WZQ2_9CYAN
MEWLEGIFEWLTELSDVNGDNFVDLSDLSAGASQAVENVFDLVDYNDNDVISSEDFGLMLQDYLDNNNNEVIDLEDFGLMLMDYFDKNGDGQFNFIDNQIIKHAAQIEEDFGPIAKKIFLQAAKLI